MKEPSKSEIIRFVKNSYNKENFKELLIAFLNNTISLTNDNIQDLRAELSIRSLNCLKACGITTIQDITALTEKEIRRVRNFGHNSFMEVEALLKRRNLSFKNN